MMMVENYMIALMVHSGKTKLPILEKMQLLATSSQIHNCQFAIQIVTNVLFSQKNDELMMLPMVLVAIYEINK